MNERVILDRLDAAASSFEWPGLDALYDFYARGYLRAFRSSSDWLVTLELFCFGTASRQFETILFVFGSDVKRGALQPFDSSRCPVRTIETAPFCDESGRPIVDPFCFSVSVHGEPRTFTPSQHDYDELALGQQAATGKIGAVARYLARTLGDSIFEDNSKILRDINAPINMRCLFRSSQWRHPDVCAGELPSQIAFFRGLARALAEDQTSHIPDVLTPIRAGPIGPTSTNLSAAHSDEITQETPYSHTCSRPPSMSGNCFSI